MTRLLFVRLENYEPVAVLELVDGEWVETEASEYFADDVVDLYLNETPEETHVWTDEDAFTTPAVGEVGEPPAPDHANSVSELFAAHVAQFYADDPDNEPVESVAFVYTALEPEVES